jgi:hypothetical protein
MIGVLNALGSQICLACLLTSAPSADPQAEFDKLFGEEARKVASTFDTKDDAAFAARLLDSAKLIKDRPTLQAVFCEKAYEFGIRNPAGLASAAQAVRLLAEIAPARKAKCQDKLLNVLQLDFRSSSGDAKVRAGEALLAELLAIADERALADNWADAADLLRQAAGLAPSLKPGAIEEINAKIRVASHRQDVDRQCKSLQAILKANPQNKTAAHQLLMLHLVDLDAPGEAVKYVEPATGEKVRTFLPLAVKALKDLPEDACMGLGDWYRDLASTAYIVSKPAMLARARACYARFLQLHTQQDTVGLKAKLSLDRTDKDLKELAKLVPSFMKEGTESAPEGVGPEIVEFAKERAGQPPDRQWEMTLAKLRELNDKRGIAGTYRADRGEIFEVKLENNSFLCRIDPLHGLPLKSLSLMNCAGIRDLSALKGMKLNELCLAGCAALPSLRSLEGVALKGKLVLKNCIGLQGDLSVLKGAPITDLDLEGCANLKSLRGIEDLPLTRLNLKGLVQLKDLSAISRMKLTWITLEGCVNLASIKGLDGMPLQETLSLRTCTCLGGDLSAISESKVTRLILSDCVNLNSLKGIENLPLTELHMQACRKVPRQEILSLARIPTLTKIYMDDRTLAESILAACRKLREQGK